MKNILICEDDPVQLKVLLAAFSRAGYATAAARSPGQALRQLEERLPDVILSDVRLEDGDAFELLQGVKRIGLDAPMIMISAYSTDALRARAVDAGVSRFFEKTSDHRELVERVNEIVRRHQAPRLGARALIVDPDGEASAALAAELERSGFDTAVAADGPQAAGLARLAQPAVDFAVVNLGSRGVDAASVVRALRAASPGMYVLLTGATPSREALRAAYAEGAQAFFRTPLPLADLARHLTGSLARAREMRRAAVEQARRKATPRRRLKGWIRRRQPVLWMSAAALAAGLFLGALWQGLMTAAEEEARRADRAIERIEQRASLPLHPPCSHR
jgi:DNA-binding response OmpR family regulator